MIGIGRHTDYAARIILHLSMLGEGAQITAEEVAQKRLMPRAFVRRIVRRLGAAGILRTSRGAGGGISLARPASKISLFDIVQAMEGGIILNACVENPGTCPLTETCPVQCVWTKITNQISDAMKSIHFNHLARLNHTPGKTGSVSARKRRSAKPAE